MKIAFTLTALLFLSFIPLSAQACPPGHPQSLAYIRRDDNRCEGVQPTEVSAALNFTSFTTHSLSNEYPDILSLFVPGTGNSKPEITLQSLVRNYLLDSLTNLTPKGTGYQFNLDTKPVLQKAKVPLTSLRATAYITRNSQPIYYPVILGSPSGKYTFVLYAPQRTRFPILEIRRNGKTLFSNPRQNPTRGEVILTWDYRNTPPGQYELYIIADQQQSGKIERRIVFEHPAGLAK